MKKPQNYNKSPLISNFMRNNSSNNDVFNLDRTEDRETYKSLLKARELKESMKGQSLEYDNNKYEDSLFEGYDEELHQTIMRNRRS